MTDDYYQLFHKVSKFDEKMANQFEQIQLNKSVHCKKNFKFNSFQNY